jgi:hypothetical protein
MTTPVGMINGSRNLGDFEYGKFRADSTDRPAVAVINGDGTNVSSGIATSDNQINGNQIVKIKETPPVDSTKNNSSTVLSYDINGDLQYIDETINGITYRTTLTYTARVLVDISEAVEL